MRITESQFKRQAEILSKEFGANHAKSLEVVARINGCKNYHEAQKSWGISSPNATTIASRIDPASEMADGCYDPFWNLAVASSCFASRYNVMHTISKFARPVSRDDAPSIMAECHITFEELSLLLMALQEDRILEAVCDDDATTTLKITDHGKRVIAHSPFRVLSRHTIYGVFLDDEELRSFGLFHDTAEYPLGSPDVDSIVKTGLDLFLDYTGGEYGHIIGREFVGHLSNDEKIVVEKKIQLLLGGSIPVDSKIQEHDEIVTDLDIPNEFSEMIRSEDTIRKLGKVPFVHRW